MKQKKIVSFLALLSLVALPSCNNQAGTTSSTTPPTPTMGGSSTTTTPDSTTTSSSEPDPEPQPDPVTYTNYTRKGSLSLDLSAGGLIGMFVPALKQASYDSEVLYTFEKASDGSMTDDAELLVHPNTVVHGGENSAYSVGKNFSTLYTIFGFPASFGSLASTFESLGVPSDVMPDDIALTGNAYNANASAETPTDEELAVRLVSGDKAVFTATSQDKLRAFAESDVSETFDTIAGLDLGGLAESLLPMVSNMDVATLLNLVDTLVDNMLPEETLRPILVAIGDAIDILSEGLDVSIEPDLTYLDGASSITLSLNEAGLQKSTEAIAGLMADNPLASLLSLSLTEASVTLEFFNESEKELINQLGGLKLDLGLSALSAPIDLSLDLSFDRESAEASETYFYGIGSQMDGYRKTDEAFHSYYSKVKPYLTDTSAIDLTASTATTIASLQTEYEALSEDVKFMLGSTVNGEAIASLYQQGRTLLGNDAEGENPSTGLIAKWDALESQSFADLSKIHGFLGNVRNYASWRDAIKEKGTKGEAILAAIDKTVSESLANVRASAEKYIKDLEAFRTNVDDATAVSAIVSDINNHGTVFDDIDDDSYFYLFTEEQKTEAEELYASVATFEDDAYDIFANAIVSSLKGEDVTIDYALLKSELMGENTLYAKSTSYKQNTIANVLSGILATEENADLLKTIDSSLDAEIENVKKEVVSTFKATEDKEAWDTYSGTVTTKLQEINKLAKAYLGQSSITNEISTLLSDLSTFFAE